MINSIDISRSISSKRIVYSFKGNGLIKYILTNFISVLLIGIFIFMAFIAFMQSATIFLSALICLVAWLISNRLVLNKLSKITCLKGDLGRSKVIEVIGENFDKYEIQDYNGELVILEKLPGIFTWGKTFTIIIDHCDIYLNIQTLMRGGTPSPYHGIINYIKSQRIRKRILFICK